MYRFEVLETLNISNDLPESASVTLAFPDSLEKLNVLGLYRPPKGDTTVFIDKSSDIISQNNSTSDETSITGDFDILYAY